MGRDYEPVKGQWYENVEEDETFRVLSVDEDADLVEIEYLDGDIEAWHEMDLERIAEPEGWVAPEDDDEEDEEDPDDEDDDEWDDDDDDDDDDDWEDDEEDNDRY